MMESGFELESAATDESQPFGDLDARIRIHKTAGLIGFLAIYRHLARKHQRLRFFARLYELPFNQRNVEALLTGRGHMLRWTMKSAI